MRLSYFLAGLKEECAELWMFLFHLIDEEKAFCPLHFVQLLLLHFLNHLFETFAHEPGLFSRNATLG